MQTPILRRGSKGQAVIAWQRIIGVTEDGDFGPLTEAKTQAWQEARGLVPDGIVGPQTWARAPETSTTVRDPLADPWPKNVVVDRGGVGDAS
jgi:peptidoglycan hydrolase-like protein with peptidoglycan-binding domain